MKKVDCVRKDVRESTFKGILLDILKSDPKVMVCMTSKDMHEICTKGWCKYEVSAYTPEGGTCMRMLDGVLVRTRVEYIISPFENEYWADVVITQVFTDGDVIYHKPFNPSKVIFLEYKKKA